MFYLASPHQKLLKAPLLPRLSLVLGGVLVVVATGLFMQSCGPVTSIFIVLVILTLQLSLLPIVVALRFHRHEARHG